MASSSGDQEVVQYKIFLSHAGMEKDFVEQLYINLDNIYPGRIFFDKDSGSLPYGENFPERILDAARNFEVAVIVISESYFKRKWPMIELAKFVSSRSQFPEKKILPLFYKLSVEELKQPKRQDGWFEEWEKFKDSRIDDETLKAWKDALRSINPLNGIQMIRGEGEVSYRKRIVQAICDMVPPVTEYDVSHIEDKDRICSFFRKKLEPFDENCSPRFFGMYAMGGMGKTTMSRVLCNAFSSKFLGKVCHVELNNHAIIDLRKALLRTLTKWSEIDMSKLTDESQVLHLLNQHVPKHRLFLVVDNVWDRQKSRQEAESFLLLPFKEGSVVLVTARSIEILNLFKHRIQWEDCFSTPFLDTDAATNLFLNSAGYKSLLQLEPKEKDLTTTFVESCCFSMRDSWGDRKYHALALTVLGGYVGQYMGPWENIKIDFKSFGQNEEKDPLFSVLEIGWEGLSEECRSLFLDIVQFMERYPYYKDVENFIKWYCAIFDVEEAEVLERLAILKRRSILTSVNGSTSGFSVHDLYHEFATREANKCTHSRNCILHEGRHKGHYRRKRLAIWKSKISSLTKQELCECSTDVEILKVGRCDQLTKVDLRGMKELLSIELLGCGSLEQVWLDDLQDLVWLNINWDYLNSTKGSPIPSIKGLKSLQVLKLLFRYNRSQSIVCESLHDCPSLIELEIGGYPELLEFPDISNSRKLKRFSGLGCPKTKSLPGLSNLKELRHLNLQHLGLTDIQGLDLLNKLEELVIHDCPNLKAIPKLWDMGRTLRMIYIHNCSNMVISLHVNTICGPFEHGVEELQHLHRLVEICCNRKKIIECYNPRISPRFIEICVLEGFFQEHGNLPRYLESFHMTFRVFTSFTP